MLLELTVFYYPNDYDADKAENLGGEPKTTKGILVINTDHIVGFNPHDNGNTMVRLTNGEVFEANVKFDSFREIMEGMFCAKDMFVSNEN